MKEIDVTTDMSDEIRVPIKGSGFFPNVGGFKEIFVGDKSFDRDTVQRRLLAFESMYDAISRPQTIDNILDGFDERQLKKIFVFLKSFDGGYVEATSE